MRELNPIEIQRVHGGATDAVQMRPDAYLGALLTPWATAPAVSISPLPVGVVTLQMPSSLQDVGDRTAGS